MKSPSRRRVLAAAGGLSSLVLAGCTGTSSDSPTSTEADTDGDGVVDSADYAPRDADVQAQSDLLTETVKRTTATSTTTSTLDTEVPSTSKSATTTTTTLSPVTEIETTTSTARPEPQYIEVTDEFTESYIRRYSSRDLDVVLTGRDPNIDSFDGKQLVVAATNYDGSFGYFVGRSQSLSYENADKVVTVDVDLSSVPRSTRFLLVAYLVPEDVPNAELSTSNATTLHETDPVERDADGTLTPAAVPPSLQQLEESSSDHHSLRLKEGTIHVSITGRSQGQPFEFNYIVFKHAYVAARRRDHGRSRPEYVTYEMDRGMASVYGQLIVDAAEEAGLTGSLEKVNFAIDIVQNYPYVSDEVSTGYDDYTKYIGEFMSECAGDCEDSSILLASVLQAEPFGYDTVLIQPPGHMGVGIKGSDDRKGTYWTEDGERYYYVETTSPGWAIGDYPEQLEDSAYVYQV